MKVFALTAVFFTIVSITGAFITPMADNIGKRPSLSLLHVALKPAASALMDSGKAFARSGEFLIDVTSEIEIYGGALSAVGALIRNSGDAIAQAAASCRFKTALELVCDELRESAACLAEATTKLKQAVEEANMDKNESLSRAVADSVDTMEKLAASLEEAGASIMKGKPETDVGACLLTCGELMENLSTQIIDFAPELRETKDAQQRMNFAAEKMRQAGHELSGQISKDFPKGKSWIKG